MYYFLVGLVSLVFSLLAFVFIGFPQHSNIFSLRTVMSPIRSIETDRPHMPHTKDSPFLIAFLEVDFTGAFAILAVVFFGVVTFVFFGITDLLKSNLGKFYALITFLSTGQTSGRLLLNTYVDKL